MFTQNLLKVTFLSAAFAFANSAAAITTYNVTSTPKINCGSDPHGLWTNTYNNAACNEYYDFQDGSTLTVDGVTAVLEATAMNSVGTVATIDIIFGGFEDTYDHYKNGGTPDYNGTDTPVDWDFYSYIIEGTISFSNQDNFTALLIGQPSTRRGTVFQPSAGMPVLQIGDGANDKSAGFGASTWLDIYGVDGESDYLGKPHHWDLNMSLSVPPSEDENDVPVPGTLILLGLGLASMRASVLRKK